MFKKAKGSTYRLKNCYYVPEFHLAYASITDQVIMQQMQTMNKQKHITYVNQLSNTRLGFFFFYRIWCSSSIVYLSDNNQKLKCRTYERIRKCNISTIKITNTNINTNKNTKTISFLNAVRNKRI
jgi:hypothetical protein